MEGNGENTRLRSDRPPRLGPVPLLILLLGLAIRLTVVLAAENRLDADEATVGVMALDILEGKELPFFFYGTAYNGGGAIEAYLGALLFSLFGPSALVLKLGMLALWGAGALLFADLCRRVLPEGTARTAVLLYAVGTPFFLEWSVKARGGFAETALFTILLLRLSAPSSEPERRPWVRGLLFGLLSGAGVWASEMLLAMIPLAGAWLLLRVGPGERKGTAAALCAGLIAGLSPLLAYDLTHAGAHWKQTAACSLLRPTGGRTPPLSLEDLRLSASFVLGRAWPLLLAALLVAGVRLLRRPRAIEIGHVVLLHGSVYLFLYWLSGLRYLPVPPSRVLYALYPGWALLLAHGAALPGGAGLAGRWAVRGGLLLWIAFVAADVTGWVSSGRAREEGSWRGSWSLVDGEGLYRHLAERGVGAAYANYWASWSLRFAARSALHRDPAAPPLTVSSILPGTPPAPDASIAVLLRRGSPLQTRFESWLAGRSARYERATSHGFVVYTGLEPSLVHRGAGLPASFGKEDWDPPPLSPDGFN